MNDLLGVNVTQSEQSLDEELPDVVLGHRLAALRVQSAMQRSVGCKLHHDVQLAVLEEAVVVLDDVLAVHLRQDAGLIDGLLPLGTVHVGDIYLFQGVNTSVILPHRLVHDAERALCNGHELFEVTECHPLHAMTRLRGRGFNRLVQRRRVAYAARLMIHVHRRSTQTRGLVRPPLRFAVNATHKRSKSGKFYYFR